MSCQGVTQSASGPQLFLPQAAHLAQLQGQAAQAQLSLVVWLGCSGKGRL